MAIRLGALAGTAILGLVVLITAAAGGLASSLLGGGGSSRPSQTAVEDIPTDYLALYQAAAATCPMDWAVLAAVGKIETDHGRSTLPGVHSGQNETGAKGPMQFLQPTFDAYATEAPGGARPPNPYDPPSAIYTAAAYLCANGAKDNADLRNALWNYNHADWYVTKALQQAAEYRGGQETGGAIVAASPAAQIALDFALAQQGTPYLWGGDGPAEGGYDCSGLTKAAYAAAGFTIPRTAQTQYDAGPLLPPSEPLQPGDLVFYGTPDRVHHVGMAITETEMINAPYAGAVVRVDPIGVYLAAGRPAGKTSSL